MSLLYIALSDLHLGEEDSVLSNVVYASDPAADSEAVFTESERVEASVPNACMRALVNFLHMCKSSFNAGKRIPYLVLIGDIADLGVASQADALRSFRTFLTEVCQREIFDRIIYVPGNHDHANWSLIRDTNFIAALKHNQASTLDQPRYATSISRYETAEVLNQIVADLPMRVASPDIFVAYPSLHLTAQNGKETVFHHGHFMEDMYRVLSLACERISKDRTIEALRAELALDGTTFEQENGPWIDFVFSGMARAGGVAKAIERIYEMLLRPDGVEELLRRLSAVLQEETDIRFLTEGMERKLFLAVLRRLISGDHRSSPHRLSPSPDPFPKELQVGLDRFLNNVIVRALNDEGRSPLANGTTLVFGHTHKPFLCRGGEGDVVRNDRFGSMPILNTGGWVLEKADEPAAGAAEPFRPAVVLGDNDGGVTLCTFPFGNGAYEQFGASWRGDSLAGDPRAEMIAGTPACQELVRRIRESARVRRAALARRSRTTALLLEKLHHG